MSDSNKKLIELIENEFNELCQKIKPSDKKYIFPTVRQDDGFEHLEIGEDEYHLIVTERGLELSRQTTKSKDEILYWLVSSFVWGWAGEFELKHRIKNQDFRRLFFAKQIEYLQKVNPFWAQRKRKEIEEILEKHPFNDDL
jgi:hypothetical protein